MKNLWIFVSFLSLTTLIGCGKSDNSAMNEFKHNKLLSKESSVRLPNGDFVKYRIGSDDRSVEATIEISSRGKCYRVSGSLPVDLIEGNDPAGQYWSFDGLKVQINPKQDDELKNNFKFVHFVVEYDEKNKVSCPAAPNDVISAAELNLKLQKTFFTDLPLTDKLLAMASPILHRGSSAFMLFFKERNLGLVFDSNSNNLIGIDVPKESLETDFVFGSGRQYLTTEKMPADELFPILMSDADIEVHQRAVSIVKTIRRSEERMKDKSKSDRDFVVSTTWADLVKNRGDKK